MLKKLLSLFGKKPGESCSEVKVSFDDMRIYLDSPGKGMRSLGWSELSEVLVQTTNLGPFGDDVFWVLRSEKEVLRFPNTAQGADEPFVQRLQKLPGFNSHKLIDAATCTQNRTFTLWSHNAKQNIGR
jgi:hypothetical protein